jgi:hypothetical protein
VVEKYVVNKSDFMIVAKAYQAWYCCPKCNATVLCSIDNFCSNCGVALYFTNAAIEKDMIKNYDSWD